MLGLVVMLIISVLWCWCRCWIILGIIRFFIVDSMLICIVLICVLWLCRVFILLCRVCM